MGMRIGLLGMNWGDFQDQEYRILCARRRIDETGQ